MNLPRIKARCRKVEGDKSFMYLDGPGNVTCAVGHLLASAKEAQRLPWSISTWISPEVGMEDRSATAAEVANDFGYVAIAKVGYAADYYQHLTRCRLRVEDREALLDADVLEFAQNLNHRFPQFSQWPEGPQEAVFDLAYNCGVSGFIDGFPHLVAILDSDTPDWKAAARHSHRAPPISEARNVEIKALFEAA